MSPTHDRSDLHPGDGEERRVRVARIEESSAVSGRSGFKLHLR